MVRNLTTLAAVTATNSTAAVAFRNPEDAQEVLKALRAEQHIVAAAVYDRDGKLFAAFPQDLAAAELPPRPQADGYRFSTAHLFVFQPISEGGQDRLGTLFIKSNLGAIYERLQLYGLIVAAVIAMALLSAYIVARRLQQRISKPILSLAATAKALVDNKDYSIRAERIALGGEIGKLTDAFNHMLVHNQIQLGRLELLNDITRAIGERQDLESIFHVVLRRLEDDLPIDFGCICTYDSSDRQLLIKAIGSGSRQLPGAELLDVGMTIAVDQNSLAQCVDRSTLVHQPDLTAIDYPLARLLVGCGLRASVLAPLASESSVLGVLIACRREPSSFSSGDCGFLRQLTEQVALASRQTQLYKALQNAYEDLRQTQQTVMQQERLRVLGQMASGIAHDINNAISPVALYTESLLETETGLSERARGHLKTIQQAIESVAETVARMREFYRERQPQLQLASVQLNKLVKDVVNLTRPKWGAESQQRGAMIDLQAELAADLPDIMGAEPEIRDALTNLLFNALDAMPNGGKLAVRTYTRPGGAQKVDDTACVEIQDSGTGMDAETQRRCLEPFFTTKGERGTGLGLAMVYGMVQRHSADIEIDSDIGRGTTVRLVFPISRLRMIPGEGLRPLQAMPRRLKLLIVDDDPLLIQSLRDALERDGHTIVAADSGQAGVDAFRRSLRQEFAFDVVITDLGMPYMDGRQVAAAIKNASPATPVILLTGWGQRMLAEQDIPPHVNRVMSKPPRLHDLRAALADLTEPADITSELQEQAYRAL
jgi:signal transduction histidine kinase/ActR/RegA family two-component response regulator